MSKEDLTERLRSKKIKLNPSQERISFPIVKRIYEKMRVGLKFDSIQVADNSTIVNGHHRYLASLFADVELEMVECPLTSAKKITQWESIDLDDKDWDTTDKVKMLNQRDARYNLMTLEELIELIA